MATIYKSNHCRMLDDFFKRDHGLRGRYTAALRLLNRWANLSDTTRHITDVPGFPDIRGDANPFDNNWLNAYGNASREMRDAYALAISAANVAPPAEPKPLVSFWITDDTTDDVDAWFVDGDPVTVYVRTPRRPPDGYDLGAHGGRSHPPK